MTISQFRSLLYKTAKFLGDVQAVSSGKIGKRVVNRVTGKIATRVIRKINPFK